MAHSKTSSYASKVADIEMTRVLLEQMEEQVEELQNSLAEQSFADTEEGRAKRCVAQKNITEQLEFISGKYDEVIAMELELQEGDEKMGNMEKKSSKRVRTR